MIETNDIYPIQDKIPQLLKPSEVASLLGLGVSTIYLLIRRNELPCIRFGRAVRVRSDDVEKFIEANVEGQKSSDVD